jgi:hypothetical protein
MGINYSLAFGHKMDDLGSEARESTASNARKI